MSSLEDVYEARRDVGKNNVASVCRRLVSLTRTSPGWPLSALNRNQPSTTLQQHLLLSDSQAELAENKLPGFESYLTSRTSQNLPQSLVPLPQIQTTGVRVSSGSNSFHSTFIVSVCKGEKQKWLYMALRTMEARVTEVDGLSNVRPVSHSRLLLPVVRCEVDS